jgi:hypothetical protein
LTSRGGLSVSDELLVSTSQYIADIKAENRVLVESVKAFQSMVAERDVRIAELRACLRIAMDNWHHTVALAPDGVGKVRVYSDEWQRCEAALGD